MGRASRRKRANGGAGFYRRQHLLAAIDSQQDDPTPDEFAATTADNGLEHPRTLPQRTGGGAADTEEGRPAPD